MARACQGWSLCHWPRPFAMATANRGGDACRPYEYGGNHSISLYNGKISIPEINSFLVVFPSPTHKSSSLCQDLLIKDYSQTHYARVSKWASVCVRAHKHRHTHTHTRTHAQVHTRAHTLTDTQLKCS